MYVKFTIKLILINIKWYYVEKINYLLPFIIVCITKNINLLIKTQF